MFQGSGTELRRRNGVDQSVEGGGPPATVQQGHPALCERTRVSERERSEGSPALGRGCPPGLHFARLCEWAGGREWAPAGLVVQVLVQAQQRWTGAPGPGEGVGHYLGWTCAHCGTFL